MMRFGKRIYKSLVDKLCKQGIVFHHVPKCGGDSVGKAMPMKYLLSRATIGPVEAIRAVEAMLPKNERIMLSQKDYHFRQELFIYLLMNKSRFIWAHIEFNETAYDMFNDKYMFITILRDPVERYISNYFYDRAYEPDSPFYISEGLAEFTNSERGIQFGRQYSKYFSGLPPTACFNGAEAIERAQRNLHKFAIVGFLHDIRGFAYQLEQTLGSKARIGHKNKGSYSASMKAELVTPEILARIRKICEPDIEIFEYARVNFEGLGIR